MEADLDMKLARQAASAWVPACGGDEVPFKSRSGKVLLYMWNRVTGEHAYYDVGSDVFLSQGEAEQALGLSQGPVFLTQQQAQQALGG